MRRYLLPPEGTFYRANLHSHSTVSDGELSPVEMKAVYKGMGYSVLAYTDHNVMISHQELTDGEFVALNGYELDITSPVPGECNSQKTCHIGLIALEPDNLRQVCWHRTKYLMRNAVNYRDQVQFYEEEPDFERVYTPECINEVMRRGRERGFFVTYNHPTWSCENYTQYIAYNYMHAMEICNYASMMGGIPEYNPRVYDEMLRAGKQIYCIGADDNHNRRSKETGRWDSGGAWTMIKAEKLEYRAITRALENGNFYASQGPEIYNLWIEDRKIHVDTSEAKQIAISYNRHRGNLCRAAEGESICSATEEIPEGSVYVRVTVMDHQGRYANSNAYFL